MTFYITGDTHSDFRGLYQAHYKQHILNQKDTVIILGDSGLNYHVDKKMAWDMSADKDTQYRCTRYSFQLKEELSTLPSTVFCIHGNHEARPETIEGYLEKEWNGGKVLYQPEFPNILFGIDGEVYTFGEKEYLIIGGAYSPDKFSRIDSMKRGDDSYKWFSDEQPSDEIKSKVEKKLQEKNWEIHGILSHTCPYKYIPRELFLLNVEQSKVDDTTEKWLDKIEKKTKYDIWYFGHFHGDKNIDKMKMLFRNIEELE